MITTLAEFCQSHPPDDWSRLPETTRSFLQQLHLPALHPLCDPNSNMTSSVLLLLLPKATTTTSHFYNTTTAADHWFDHFITTVIYQTLLPFLALVELWLRLFCGYFVPLALAYQFLRLHQQGRTEKQQQQLSTTTTTTTTDVAAAIGKSWFWLITLAACMILMTDSNYVYEYGPWYGCFCFGSCWLVGAWWWGNNNGAVATTTMILFPLPFNNSSSSSCEPPNTITITTTMTDTKHTSNLSRNHWITIVMTTLILGLTLKLTLWDGKDCLSFPPHVQFGTDIDIHIQPGVYYDDMAHRHNKDNDNDDNNMIGSSSCSINDNNNNNNKCHYQSSTLVQRAMALWSPDKYTYQDPTPWILTGDARTGLPYLWNRPVFPDYYTVYLTTSNDDAFGDNRLLPEIVAVAMAFPPATGYNASAPFYVVAHGMNGGPEDGYIQDFVNRRTAAGSSVAILLARGLHGMPLVSGQIFSVARTSDLHALAKALRQVHPGPIGGVGYSIGAIVLSHYVMAPQYSDEPFPLDAAFSISGALDARQETTYYRPQRIWLPMIAEFFRSHQYVLPSNDAAGTKNDPDSTYITSAKLLHQRLETRQQVQAMMRAKHTIDLDENSIVPFYNYSSALAYYAHQSALGDIAMPDWSSPDLPSHVPKQSQLARHLKIPLGVLHSLDDPIASWRNNFANTGWMHPERLVQLNENLVLILTDRGGHVGWPLSNRPWRHGWEFMNEAASSFVEAVVAAQHQQQSKNKHTTRRP